MKTAILSVVAGVLLTVFPARASAAPVSIGSFSFDSDPLFGPLFTVENFSEVTLGAPGGSFLGGAIHLLDGTTAVQDLTFGAVAPGSLFQTTDDLSTLLFDNATLDLKFSVPGVVTVGALTGLRAALAGPISNPIAFTAEAPPETVPEPPTWLLVASGLGLCVVVARRRQMRRPLS